jgi:peptidoglycan/LPS O-acetylase OafA/YrhL
VVPVVGIILAALMFYYLEEPARKRLRAKE